MVAQPKNKNSVYIIAEAGINHNGDFAMAKELARVAKECGADAVKYQTYITENLLRMNAPKAAYQVETTGDGDSQFDMLKKYELSQDEFKKLKVYCDEIGITFMSSPFDVESAKFLAELKINPIKLPSGEITNTPLLDVVAEHFEEIIFSTGMSQYAEIENALDVLRSKGPKKQITVLHCNTSYPTPLSDVNLKAMPTFSEKYGTQIGYSDHTLGLETAIASVALGATVIEKHFTLDRNMEGPDHQASVDPDGLESLVQAIRNTSELLGQEAKIISESEAKNKEVARKSICALTTIKAGEKFDGINLTTKRPGDGLSPLKWRDLIGKVAKRDYSIDENILASELD